MTIRTIEVSESTYQMLLKQAARFQLTPEHVLERLLAGDLPLSMAEWDVDPPISDTMNALAAVERLTTLFAGVHIDDLEAHLNDPMLALVNEELDHLGQ